MKLLNKLKNDRQDLISNLLDNIESLEKLAFEQQAEIEKLKAEIERLQEENKNHKSVIEAIEDTINPLPFETDFDKAIKTAKSEAIKEFAEQVKENVPKMCWMNEIDKDNMRRYIDNLVKEMVGDDNA